MIRASSVLFWFGLTIAASLALYYTSDRVHQLDVQLRTLNTSIEAEQQSIHVLKAEWVYLANPARIEAAAKKHLALRPTAPTQVTSLNAIGEILPTRGEAMASVSVTGKPVANVRTSLAALTPRPAAALRHQVATVTVASADTGHINDHMMIERTATLQAPPDYIGSMLTELGTKR